MLREGSSVDQPIRVLQVVTHMNRGGLETMIMNYYRQIDREKVQFDFLTHRPESEKKDYNDEILALGGRIFHLPKLNPFSPFYLKQVHLFFRNHPEYKIIHVHLDCMSSVILKIAEMEGVPVRIAHSHSSNQDKNLKYLLKVIYKRSIKKYATHLFACGETAGKWMFGTDNFHIISNAINTKDYTFNVKERKHIRDEFHLKNDDYVIGHVGRFSVVKNQTFLLNVFEYISKIHQNVKLILVGEGTEFLHIKKLVQKKGLEESVIFTGLRKDVNKLMQAMDVFVFPSLYEGVPVALIEAQVANLPCIVSDKVSCDSKISLDFNQVDLKAPLSCWEDAIMKYKNKNRLEGYGDIDIHNYDINDCAIKLQYFYIQGYKNL